VTIGNAPRHGGNLAAAERRFGVPAYPWLDLSTGINPHIYPLPEIPLELWHRLPEPHAVAQLIAAAATCYGAEGAPMAAAPGTQALIQILPRLIRPSPVAVLGPTYNEHERSWRMAGHNVASVDDPDEIYSHTRILILANPNNPDGRRIEPERIATWADVMVERGGFVVVDEAFADIDPGLSVAHLAGRPGLAILRSFGKFFGLSGVRLGFLLGDDELVTKMRAAIGPWPISGPAIAIAAKAFADVEWIECMRRRLAAERKRLEEMFAYHGLAVAGATDLFVLVRDPRALDIAIHLGHNGILVREFPERPELLRFGLPGTDEEWRRLDLALQGYREDVGDA
jgi:cobalamin biosynthetic protein CobC